MASQVSNHGSSLSRHRPAIFAMLAVVVGCTGYYIFSASSSSPNSTIRGQLRRSNAVRRYRQRSLIDTKSEDTSQNEQFPLSPLVLRNSFHYGYHIASDTSGKTIQLPLVNKDLMSASDIAAAYTISYRDAVNIRDGLEVAFLDAFFARTMPVGDIVLPSECVRQRLVQNLGMSNGLSPKNIEDALDRYCNGHLENHPNRVERREHAREEGQRSQQDVVQAHGVAAEQHRNSAEGLSAPSTNEQVMGSADTPVDPGYYQAEAYGQQPSGETNQGNVDETTQVARSPTETVVSHSWQGDGENQGDHKKQTVLGLIYHIAEEQARKEGYIHRGVTCNGCNTLPIRGIRYRCTNCADYDLCELCESQQIHDRTHLFYKVRIPAPFLGNPRQPQPVWYPGKPRSHDFSLDKEYKAWLCQRTGLQMPQVEALWEQFKCLAAVDFPEDPSKYYLAIDRLTFDRCFVPKSTTRPPPPNLIYDRMFSFYDINDDGLIGFQEFIFGIQCIAFRKPEDRLRQVFDGFDFDNDGVISRIDLQRMFKSLFNLHKELSKDIVARMDDDLYDEDAARDIVNGSQAISSAFSGRIGSADPSRVNEGKEKNDFGDFVIMNDSIETVKPEDTLLRNWPEEQDYGQEILYDVIHDSINELLDPLFRFREEVGREILLTKKEREQCGTQLAKLHDCGFWVGVTVLVNRYEKDWITSAEDTSYDTPHNLAKLITNHSLFYRYNPSKKLYDERREDFADTWEPLKIAGLIDVIPQYAKTEAEADESRASLRKLRDDLGPLMSLEDYTKRIVPYLEDIALFPESLPVSPVDEKSHQDEAEPADPEHFPQMMPKSSDFSMMENAPTTTTTSQPFPYEYSDTERPTDPTLPQNRPHSLLLDNGISVALPSPSSPFPDRVNGILEPGCTPKLPGQPQRTLPLERLKYLSLLQLLEEGDNNRGGPGRVSWGEFEEIMKGPKGQDLAFLGSWIEMATF